MEVTIKKRLNGLEIHPAYTTPEGQEIEMKVGAWYWVEVPELGYRDRRYLDLKPLLVPGQLTMLKQALTKADQIVQQHE